MIADYNEDIQAILKRDDVADFMKQLVKAYSTTSWIHALDLGEFAIECMKASEKLLTEQLSTVRSALHWSVISQYLNKSDPSTLLAAMMPVCMCLFPDGYVHDDDSLAMKFYYAKFIELLTNKKAFDMSRDKEWLDTFGYTKFVSSAFQHLDITQRCNNSGGAES